MGTRVSGHNAASVGDSSLNSIGCALVHQIAKRT